MYKRAVCIEQLRRQDNARAAGTLVNFSAVLGCICASERQACWPSFSAAMLCMCVCRMFKGRLLVLILLIFFCTLLRLFNVSEYTRLDLDLINWLVQKKKKKKKKLQ